MATDLGNIAAKMTLNISDFTNKLNLAKSQAQKVAEQTSKAMNMGSSLSQVGTAMTKYITLPLAAIATASVKVGNEFQAQMSKVQAISGATGDELKRLRDQSVELGASTAFSAKESAAGMENLASAGFDVNEIMGAMPGLLDLAAVSGGDVAASAEVMASTLNAFGLEATDAGHVANVFARAAADTNAEAADMGEAMKYVAPVAKAMGLSIEETAASIGIMADAGIKGSQAGTTLRGALSSIVKPTKAMNDSMNELGISFFDANGEMLPLVDQIGILKNATAGLTEEERNRHIVTLYGQESLSGMLALIDAGPDKLAEMTNSLVNSTDAAADMAAVMQDNAASSIEQMFGAMESAGIIIQEILEPAIRAVADGIGNMVQKFVNASPLAQKMIVIFAGIVGAIGPLLAIIGSVIMMVAKFKIAFQLLGPAMLGLTGTIALVVAGVVALIGVFMLAYVNSETFRNGVNWLVASIRDGLAAAIQFVKDKFVEFMPYLQAFGAYIGDVLAVALQRTVEWFDKLGPRLQVFGDKVKLISEEYLGKFGTKLDEVKEKLGTGLGKAVETIGGAMDNMGGAFGKAGTILGFIASIALKVAIAFLGLTGPIGLAVGIIGSFLIAWAKTGELNADGITMVFEQLGENIAKAGDFIAKYLPVLIQVGVDIILKLVEGIVSAIPMISNVFNTVITSLADIIGILLPIIVDVGVKILTALIQGIIVALPIILGAMLKIMDALINIIITLLPMIIDVGVKLLLALIQGLLVALPQLITAVIQILPTIINTLVGLLPMIIDAGIQILMALISGLISMLPILITAIIQILMALVGALLAALPQLIQAGIQILMALINGIISMLPAIIEAIITIVLAILTALIDALPQILAAGIQLLMALLSGIVQIFPQVVAMIFELGWAILSAIISFVGQMLGAGIELIASVVSGIWEKVTDAASAAKGVGTAVWDAIKSFVGNMLSAGGELISNVVNGINDKVSSAASAAKSVGTAVVDAIKGFFSDMVSAGSNLVAGFTQGISDSIGSAVEKAKEMASSTVSTVKEFLNINSPSKVLTQLGEFTGQGFANGIGNMIGKVVQKAKTLASKTSDAMSDVKFTLPKNSLMSSIVEGAAQVKQALQSTLDSNPYQLVAQANTSTGLSPLASGDTMQPKAPAAPEVKPSKSGGGDNDKPQIIIENITVRDETDLDVLTNGLYDRNAEVLKGLGNTRK